MLLIDGHNLIGRTPDLSLQREEEAREAVLRRVAAAKGSGGERVVVVFDGNRPGSAKESRFGGIRVVFSPAGRTADEEILRRLGKTNPRTTRVVTSDRDLAARALGLGAAVVSCEAFLGRLAKRTRPGEPTAEKPEAGPAEVEAWIEAFAAGESGNEHKM